MPQGLLGVVGQESSAATNVSDGAVAWDSGSHRQEGPQGLVGVVVFRTTSVLGFSAARSLTFLTPYPAQVSISSRGGEARGRPLFVAVVCES